MLALNRPIAHYVFSISLVDSACQLKQICVPVKTAAESIICSNFDDPAQLNATLPLQVSFKNMLSIDLNLFNPPPSDVTVYPVEYVFVDSTFNFYHNDQLISHCNTSILNWIEHSVFGVMVDLALVDFVRFERKICPYVFKNARLERLYTVSYDHFVVRSLFRFEVTSFVDLNSLVVDFRLGGYNYKLDSSVFYYAVFHFIHSVLFSGLIKSIQVNLFSSFHTLRSVGVVSDDLKNFFHKVGVDWTYVLNSRADKFSCRTNDTRLVEANFFDLKFDQVELVQNSNYYQFPDEDFCIFSILPIDKVLIS